MATSNQFLSISSTYKFFGLLTLTLLLVNVCVVNAQVNTNSTNSNNSNASVNANLNSNANANTNANANQNGNAKKEGGASPTPGSGEEYRQNELAGSIWFPAIIILMFGSVLIGFAYTITRAIRFSKETFRSKSGLPEGSLRAMLAFMLVAFLGFYVLASILSFSAFKPPDFLLGVVATVIGFYFGSRTGEDKSAAPQTGTVQGDVVDKDGTPAVGASVELSQSGVKKLTLTADASGKYKFNNVQVGDYEIQASLTGKAPSDPAKVKVTAGAAETVKLKLK